MSIINGCKLGSAVLVGLVTAVSVTASHANDGDPVHGRHKAIEICSDCHLVAEDQANQDPEWLPQFRALAKRGDVDKEWLETFFRTPHLEMPESNLSDAEVADIIAYFLSLKPEE
jgi:mono/diheme cytochrome c family protein